MTRELNTLIYGTFVFLLKAAAVIGLLAAGLIYYAS